VAIVLTPNTLTIPASGGTADLIIVTEANAAGTTVAPNVTVTVSASAGTLSASSVTTDFTGHGKVTWTGSSAATITVTAGAVASSVTIALSGPATGPPSSPPPPNPGPTPTPGPTAPAGDLAITVHASPPASNDSTKVTLWTDVRDQSGDVSRLGMTYAWDFNNDGLIDTNEMSPTRLFGSGRYAIVVDVFAVDGRHGRGSYDLAVGATPPPPPMVTVTGAASSKTVPIGDSVSLSANVTPNQTAGAVTSVVWDFGDGSSGSGTSTAHTYTALGTFVAAVTATTANGAVATASVTITATKRPLLINLTSLQTSPAPTASFTFTATVSSLDPPPAGTTYQWDYSSDGTYDETTGTTNTTSQVIACPVGTKRAVTVKATTTDGRTMTVTITVTVS